ncbi:MAG: hypothetical protein ACRD6W_17365 [Nitrososphaerales archaeon]
MLWPKIVDSVEEQWRKRFGEDVVNALREALDDGGRAMPWSPPEVHPSDGFFTQVFDGDVPDAELPLVALLGKALTNATLDHEKEARVSLPLGANLLRLLQERNVRIRDLSALSGLSKEGITMATGYLQRKDLARRGPERSILLTFKGVDALADYERRAARRENRTLREALRAVLEQSDALGAGLVPPLGCWRSKKPYLTQTERLATDPTGALPWHPMVLHRGGWPDAS